MKIYGILNSFGDPVGGAYSDPGLANKVLKIVRMAVDDGAELDHLEVDICGEELRSGLLPYKIEIIRSVATGKVLEKRINLTWPPKEEGIVEEREDYIQYFFWAKTQNEAIGKLSTVRRPATAQEVRDSCRQEAY